MRPAVRLVKLARSFRSSISLQIGRRVADARSITAIMLLCGTLGTVVDLEAAGSDEEVAVNAIAELFESGDRDDSEDSDRENAPAN
jgi:phosphocarrier protein HPr